MHCHVHADIQPVRDSHNGKQPVYTASSLFSTIISQHMDLT